MQRLTREEVTSYAESLPDFRLKHAVLDKLRHPHPGGLQTVLRDLTNLSWFGDPDIPQPTDTPTGLPEPAWHVTLIDKLETLIEQGDDNLF